MPITDSAPACQQAGKTADKATTVQVRVAGICGMTTFEYNFILTIYL